MESLVELRGVTYHYPEKEEPALEDINLTLDPGEFALLIGPSGCGKTTLLETIAGVVPEATGGRIRGKVLINGVDTLRDSDKQRGVVGLILQDPEVQLTNLYVEDEVAFGPENLCLPVHEIRTRVEEAMRYARIHDLRHSFVYALSGGQKQRVAIAAGLALKPKVLLMDGPMSNLDPQGAEEVLELITRMRETGDTQAVLISANKIDTLLPLATRVVVMDAGAVVLDGSPEYVILEHLDDLKRLGVFIPELGMAVGSLLRHHRQSLPRTIDQAYELLTPLHLPLPSLDDHSSNDRPGDTVIEVNHVTFGYSVQQVLHDLSLSVKSGEFLAVVGQNGSGKTTLMKLIAGLLKPQSGQITVGGEATRDTSPLGRVGYVFQYPEHQFVTETVEDELRLGLTIQDLSPQEIESRIDEMLEHFALEKNRKESPYTLSMGEKRRLSVATMLIIAPEILILDEPTTGLDRKDTDNLMRLLQRLVRERGITVIQVSHDMEQIAEYASRVIVLHGGRIVFDDSPRTLFADQDLLALCKLQAPPIALLAQRLWPDTTKTPITVSEFSQEVTYAAVRV